MRRDLEKDVVGKRIKQVEVRPSPNALRTIRRHAKPGKVRELDHIAIDPLEDTFTWQAFGELLAQRASKLKPLLMDQKFVSGLGNIYSDEVLFAAGLRHDRMSDSLSSQEVRR